MYCVRWSNEAATIHADITADHRDVPVLLWHEAKPRTSPLFTEVHFLVHEVSFGRTSCSTFEVGRDFLALGRALFTKNHDVLFVSTFITITLTSSFFTTMMTPTRLDVCLKRFNRGL